MYKDAIDTASQSKDGEIAEELLRFFVSVQDRACFAATLFTCYDLISPDIAIELAWRNGYTDFAMPYMYVLRLCCIYNILRNALMFLSFTPFFR